MDELLKQLSDPGAPKVFDVPTTLLILGAATVFSLLLALAYRLTHRGLSYSVSYVHSLVFMAVTTAVIMLIIGSNIARAFSLVGALSIIRFRNAVKETRDVAFLFMAMAVGMAAGTGFLSLGMIFTLFMLGLSWLLSHFEVGALKTREMVLTVQLPEGLDHRTVFNEVFLRHVDAHSLLSMESIRGGTSLELVYSVSLKRDAPEETFLKAVRDANQNHKVSLAIGRDNADL